MDLSKLIATGETDVPDAAAVDERDQQGHAYAQAVPTQGVRLGRLENGLRLALRIKLLQERLVKGAVGIVETPELKWEGLAVVGENLLSRVIQHPELDLPAAGEIPVCTVLWIECEVEAVCGADIVRGVIIKAIRAPQLLPVVPVGQHHIAGIALGREPWVLFEVNIDV